MSCQSKLAKSNYRSQSRWHTLIWSPNAKKNTKTRMKTSLLSLADLVVDRRVPQNEEPIDLVPLRNVPAFRTTYIQLINSLNSHSVHHFSIKIRCDSARYSEIHLRIQREGGYIIIWSDNVE
ncbi:hypothetical protein ALC53_03402 [Atta colombica]|uniref:Uncharacterized protein n=1 Tax=Atta colombica TaxID=520822 RepID=A0A195BN92_9HYME|nr:hypothetical protein ALC53_03402 [Atta colombica]